MLARILIATTAAATILGPPRISVRTSDLPAGAIALVEAHYHTDEDEARVYGTAYAWQDGRRTEQELRLTRRDAHHYTVSRSWPAGQPRVLVLGVEQGKRGEHGVAEALVRVDASGRVTNVDVALTKPISGHELPRRVNDREIENALLTIRAAE